MPISDWFGYRLPETSNNNKREETHPRYGQIDDLVDTIRNQSSALQESQIQSERHQVRIRQLEEETSKLQEALKKANVESKTFRDKSERQKKHIKDLNLAINKAREELIVAVDETNWTKADKARLEFALEQSQSIINDLKFDIELLKCSPESRVQQNVEADDPEDSQTVDFHASNVQGGPNPSSETSKISTVTPVKVNDNGNQREANSIPPVPFVAVLVDGDAYTWSEKLSNAMNTTPGALAAQYVKEEVQKHILANRDSIPIQAKIVVRVICNFCERYRPDSSSKHGKHVKRAKAVSKSGEFMTQFSESMPLFDFFDAGNGKERADEKIKENFHIFISNPHCHAVFLACCTDNGFARLLEQYSNSISARQKIILVHPGYVVEEISKLKLTAVEWPRVFATRVMPIEQQAKILRREALERKLESEQHKIQVEGEAKYGPEEWARMLMQRGMTERVHQLVRQASSNEDLRYLTGLRYGGYQSEVHNPLRGECEEPFDNFDTGVD